MSAVKELRDSRGRLRKQEYVGAPLKNKNGQIRASGKKDKNINVRVWGEDLEFWRKIAEENNMKFTDFVQEAINHYAKKLSWYERL